MPQKNPQCSAMDQSESDLPSSCCHTERPTGLPAGGRKKADSGQGNGDTSSSSPESGSLNGEGKRSGKSRRRRKRASNSDSCPERKADGSGLKEEGEPRQGTRRPADTRSALLALQSECAAVWFECSIYERAESRYQCWLACSSARPVQPTNQPSASPPRRPVEGSPPQSFPNTLDLPTPPVASAAPDEGYHSQAPTPAALTQQSVTPNAHQPINGLPRLPVELLRDVWLEKPLYDHAEAAFYQSLHGNNSSKRAGSLSTPRSGDRPQRLVEEEEEEKEVAVEEKRVVPQGKAEVFHALHPIQEEEEPAETTTTTTEEGSAGGVSFCLHPDSERVWLDRCRYDAAESRFYGHCERRAATSEGAPGPAATLGTTGPLRDNTMSAVDFLSQEKIWFEKPRYDEAERHFYEHMNGPSPPAQDVGANSILQDIARARENIQKSLAGLKSTLFSRGSGQPPPSHQSHLGSSSVAGDQGELVSRMKSLEFENQSLHKVVDDLRAALSKLECRVAVLEKCPAAVAPAPALATPCTNGTTSQPQKNSAPATQQEEDDDFDLFGSDEEDPEAEQLKEQRLKEYAEKKAKKPALIAKSSILLDVKPWDDETDMVKLEECVRSIQTDGLLWGTSKLVAVGYGIKKLQIACVVEDDKVGTDLLEEEITRFDDYVQSVDVAAFNKI